jgi:GMP synthase-like glutamine amidotransferase
MLAGTAGVNATGKIEHVPTEGTTGAGMRRVLVFQHSEESPLGVMAPVLADAGVAVEVLNGETGCRLPPDAAEASGMILLGGAMSANDDARCPHFPELLNLIRAFTAAAKPVLGLCLGGQLIARALGGAVIEQARGEFGFTALHGRDGVREDPLLGGLKLPAHVMQWHNDHFTVPDGAAHLLESQACPGQAFRAGARTYAFQCHFEVDATIVDRWAGLRAELVGDPTVVSEMTVAAERHLTEAMAFGRTVTERWLQLGGFRTAPAVS